jgi:hypothetical protein
MTVKSILLDIRDNDTDFHGEKGTLRVVLYDIGFSYGKCCVVKELKITNPKFMLNEILSEVKIDELIEEHGPKVYI